MQTEGLLKQSQQLATELQTQQRELQQTNEQLEQKAQQLADRNVEVEAKNQEIEQARRAVEEKATELALTSKYKSEFLANMSHELRTPLNSILILGQQLTENPDGNLTNKQVEFARTIHGAGTDLLNLISDILDLSKIESGTVSVDAEEVYFSNLLEMIARPFRHEAENRRLQFEVAISPNLDRSIITDSKRLQQVLKNLLSNAFKFTAEGGVRLSGVARGERLERRPSDAAPRAARWWPSRCPTPASAFRRRSSASSSRRFSRPTPAPAASTAAPGLGLRSAASSPTCWAAKSNCAARPAMGSVFTLYLPLTYLGSARAKRSSAPSESAQPARPRRRRRCARRSGRPSRSSMIATRSTAGDSVVLIVEDDPHYARIMMASRQGEGFKVLVAHSRRRRARARARASSDGHLARYLPARHAGLDGLEPAQAGPGDAAHSRADRDAGRGPASWAGARRVFLRAKARRLRRAWRARSRASRTTRRPRRKRLLLVEDDEAERKGVAELLGHEDIEITAADTGAEALAQLRDDPVDCVVLDLKLPDMSGFEVLETHPRRCGIARRAGGGVHRPRAVRRRRRAAAHHGAQRRGQGRRIAGAPAG